MSKEKKMAEIKFKGNSVHTIGSLPRVGDKAPDFKLTASDLSDKSLKDFAGKKKILNIVHSLDTGTCAQSARTFNKLISKKTDTVVLTVSKDLPFAQSRFCSAEGIDNVITLSQMRDMDFGKNYGVQMIDGPIAGLLARSIVVVDENDQVIYTQQVPEVSQEPDYDEVMAAI
jgi:thiol peroxidase